MAVEAPLKPRNVSWYSWSSAKYWQLSDKLSASADSNRVWSSITRSLNLNSKGLALGPGRGHDHLQGHRGPAWSPVWRAAEVPIHMPLVLFTIVSFFRHRRWAALDIDARSSIQSAQAAAKDANSMVGWGWSWIVE